MAASLPQSPITVSQKLLLSFYINSARIAISLRRCRTPLKRQTANIVMSAGMRKTSIMFFSLVCSMQVRKKPCVMPSVVLAVCVNPYVIFFFEWDHLGQCAFCSGWSQRSLRTAVWTCACSNVLCLTIFSPFYPLHTFSCVILISVHYLLFSSFFLFNSSNSSPGDCVLPLFGRPTPIAVFFLFFLFLYNMPPPPSQDPLKKNGSWNGTSK